jgi:hypothetical protein
MKLNTFEFLVSSEKYIILPFTCALIGHCKIINWTDFNIVVSQEIGRLKREKERQGSGQQVEPLEHIQHLSIKFTTLYECSLWIPQTIMMMI